MSTPSDRPPDWRLGLIAVNLALPELVDPVLRLFAGPVRATAFLACLAGLLFLNFWLCRFPAARPWAVLAALLTAVAGLVFGTLGFFRIVPLLPLLLSFTPSA